MIDKKIKKEILEKIKNKDEKILISTILDKAIRFDKSNLASFTNFLNLNELNIAKKILEYLNIEYTIFAANDSIEKKNIAFIPNYLKENLDKLFSEHVSCLKIITSSKTKLVHKDYMGAIYSLGVKREFIGDIIVNENGVYFFCMKNMEDYFLINLNSVGNQQVKIEVLDVNSLEVKNLSLKFIEKEFIIPSLRVDALLSEVYNLSRSETKDKIVKGDLFINDKNIFYPNTIIKVNDIISFKRCGKLKVGNKIRETKSLNSVIKIFKYN